MSTETDRPNHSKSKVSGYLFLERIGNIERSLKSQDLNLLVLIGRDLDGSKIEVITKNEEQREVIDRVLAKHIAAGRDIKDAGIVIGYNAVKVSYLDVQGGPTGRAETFLNADTNPDPERKGKRVDYAWFPAGEVLDVLRAIHSANLTRLAAAEAAVDCALIHARTGNHEGALMAALSFAEDFGGQKLTTVKWGKTSSTSEVGNSPEDRAAVRLNMVEHRTPSALAPIAAAAPAPAEPESPIDVSSPAVIADEPNELEIEEDEEMTVTVGIGLGGMF